MRENGGCIINVSSVGGSSAGSPTNGPYTASKAGLNHLTKTLALEMAPFNIRVNAIAPGAVRTEDPLAESIPETTLSTSLDKVSMHLPAELSQILAVTPSGAVRTEDPATQRGG